MRCKEDFMENLNLFDISVNVNELYITNVIELVRHGFIIGIHKKGCTKIQKEQRLFINRSSSVLLYRSIVRSWQGTPRNAIRTNERSRCEECLVTSVVGRKKK